ncbi:hypothetical protein DFJ73DRAFT_959064 [Zopfochytrium polystomum]|nr:hypothetical protein DFJ73DRAFT_959064 [Zopfochytrium polystomum]
MRKATAMRQSVGADFSAHVNAGGGSEWDEARWWKRLGQSAVGARLGGYNSRWVTVMVVMTTSAVAIIGVIVVVIFEVQWGRLSGGGLISKGMRRATAERSGGGKVWEVETEVWRPSQTLPSTPTPTSLPSVVAQPGLDRSSLVVFSVPACPNCSSRISSRISSSTNQLKLVLTTSTKAGSITTMAKAAIGKGKPLCDLAHVVGGVTHFGWTATPDFPHPCHLEFGAGNKNMLNPVNLNRKRSDGESLMSSFFGKGRSSSRSDHPTSAKSPSGTERSGSSRSKSPWRSTFLSSKAPPPPPLTSVSSASIHNAPHIPPGGGGSTTPTSSAFPPQLPSAPLPSAKLPSTATPQTLPNPQGNSLESFLKQTFASDNFKLQLDFLEGSTVTSDGHNLGSAATQSSEDSSLASRTQGGPTDGSGTSTLTPTSVSQHSGQSVAAAAEPHSEFPSLKRSQSDAAKSAILPTGDQPINSVPPVPKVDLSAAVAAQFFLDPQTHQQYQKQPPHPQPFLQQQYMQFMQGQPPQQLHHNVPQQQHTPSQQLSNSAQFQQNLLASYGIPQTQNAAQYTGRVANGVAISRSKTAGSTATRVVPTSTAATAAVVASAAAAAAASTSANARASFIAPTGSAAAAAAAAAAGIGSPSPFQSLVSAPKTSPSPAGGKPPSPVRDIRLPVTPEVALHYFRDVLVPSEQREMFSFSEIYFVGNPGVAKIGSPGRRTGAEGLPPGTVSKEDEIGIFNDGYDDSNGDYYLTVGDHMGFRYEIKSLLGKGSFGQVARCYDHKTKTFVALKVIRNKKRFEKQGVVEVKVLDKIRREDVDDTYNAVHMKDSFYFRHHLCITFELLGSNLYEWVKAGQFRGVHSGVIKRFAVQIVECMVLMSKFKIVHCDLKPENILLRDPSFTHPDRCDTIQSTTDSRAGRVPADFDPSQSFYEIKAIDFGSSCFEAEKIYTYVQSRFYRSPEVILGISYTVAIDMWSLGCILAELFIGYPLFPGENEQEQLSCIMEVKGVPPEDLIERGSRRKLFFESNGNPRPYTNSKGKKRKPGAKTLAGVLRYADPVFLDFLERCLEWDPEKRLVPEEAIRHEWLREYISLGKSQAALQVCQELVRQQQLQQYQLQYQQLEQEYDQVQLRRHPSSGSRMSSVSTTSGTTAAKERRRADSTGAGSSASIIPIPPSGTSSPTGTTASTSSWRLAAWRKSQIAGSKELEALSAASLAASSMPQVPTHSQVPAPGRAPSSSGDPSNGPSPYSAGPIDSPVFFPNQGGPGAPPPINTAMLANLMAAKAAASSSTSHPPPLQQQQQQGQPSGEYGHSAGPTGITSMNNPTANGSGSGRSRSNRAGTLSQVGPATPIGAASPYGIIQPPPPLVPQQFQQPTGSQHPLSPHDAFGPYSSGSSIPTSAGDAAGIRFCSGFVC